MNQSTYYPTGSNINVNEEALVDDWSGAPDGAPIGQPQYVPQQHQSHILPAYQPQDGTRVGRSSFERHNANPTLSLPFPSLTDSNTTPHASSLLRPRTSSANAMTNPVDPYPLYPSQDDEDDDPDGIDTGSNRGNNAPIHKRGYQACERCRQRKTKCEPPGGVDNPLPGPCARCARERFECNYAPTRKKRKVTGESLEESERHRLTYRPPGDNTPDGFGFSPPTTMTHSLQYAATTSSPQLKQWAPPQVQNLQPSSNVERIGMNAKGGAQLRSDAAQDSLHKAVATTQDGLHLLMNAAMKMPENATDLKSPPVFGASPLSVNSAKARTFSSNTMTPAQLALAQTEESVALAGVKVWDNMRFVRAGWFTAAEAMQYVEYFYDKMAPLTPVVIPDYRSPLKHEELLIDEPVLAIAILAIASRHLRLEGHAAMSRSYRIHDNLWQYLKKQLERVLFAQEQFGGGFCGAGSSARVTENTCGQLTWKGSLRTLGTIEAILLLTDWQPQALHFPPGDDENRLLGPDLAKLMVDNQTQGPVQDATNANEHSSLPFSSWLEPSWRSDRMSWMLLTMAQGLCFELGVFDKSHYDCQNNHDPTSDCARKMRVRRLVLIYISQCSGRLGLPSSLPLDRWKHDEVYEKTSQMQRNNQPEDPVDLMQASWLGIASIMYEANQQIFPSRQFTRDLTSSGQYMTAIDSFKPKLQKWKDAFDAAYHQLPPLMRHILSIEYEYARMYINSLGFQKVVESFGGKPSAENLRATYQPNAKYIEAVTDSSRNILTAVVDGLAPGGHVKNGPTRLFTRVLSGMLFALKASTDLHPIGR